MSIGDKRFINSWPLTACDSVREKSFLSINPWPNRNIVVANLFPILSLSCWLRYSHPFSSNTVRKSNSILSQTNLSKRRDISRLNVSSSRPTRITCVPSRSRLNKPLKIEAFGAKTTKHIIYQSDLITHAMQREPTPNATRRRGL